MNEAVNVAKSKGIFLKEDIVTSNILKTKQAGMIKTSMLQDMEKGKKCEIDAINGAITRFGKENGISVPVNETLHNLVTFISKKG
jgi:2-dehydropantoate 2-reductase